MDKFAAAQEWTEGFLAEESSIAATSAAAHAAPAIESTPRQRRFSPFFPDDSRRARELANRFVTLADSSSDKEAALEQIRRAAQDAANTEGPGLVRFALMTFMTHHPVGRQLEIQPLETRAPAKVLPSTTPAEAARVEVSAAAVSLEDQLNWYREDAKANEHHEHWHVVYPNGGLPTTGELNDRHGELFFYMHQQMLARYDTERLAVGLDRVKPLGAYEERIPEGYDPGPSLTERPGPQSLDVYSPREPGLQLKDVEAFERIFTVDRLKEIRDRLHEAVDGGSFLTGKEVDAVSLGNTEESSIGSVSPETYGNHHGNGHVLLAFIDSSPSRQTPGVMIDIATAIRDPVFYRWHKHVDDVSFRWQEAQSANDFSDAPSVLIRKGLDGSATENRSPDILLCFGNQIPHADDPNRVRSFGEEHFGGENWTKDFSTSEMTTDELHTEMLEREIVLPDRKVKVPYLDQREFYYFLRVENLLDQTKDVVVRIFLVATEVADDRRMWIEMDKFRHTLQPSQRAVICRPAKMSSVIRKPAVKPPGARIERPDVDDDPSLVNDTENYCSCGWPYNLLLPRGTREGMGFRLMVMVTDWEKDRVQHDTACGSMSFCGTKSRYPDKRTMGYPFDRPFTGSSVSQTIAEHDNMATRDITIRWVNAPG